MHLAYPFPAWLAVVAAAAIGVVAFVEYRRPLAPLTRARRGVLAALRVLTLTVLVLCHYRPVIVQPPASSREAIVPELDDV